MHGFYHRSAVKCMAAALRLPTDSRLSATQWASAAQGGYDDMLKTSLEYQGPQGFPYKWIPDGMVIAQSLRPHLSLLYDACVSIAVCPRPSFCIIDTLLPQDLGRYSMSSTSRCRYMRRHLARWILCYVYPHVKSNAADWNLCLNGMGSGPPKAAAVLDICSYSRALALRRVLSKALGRGYSIYDLVCFLCLAAGELRKEVGVLRRRTVCKGIRLRGGRYLVTCWDGTRSRYVGSRSSLCEAKELYTKAARLGKSRVVLRAGMFRSGKPACLVYPFRGKYQAFLRCDGVRAYIGLYPSAAAAAAAIRARR